MKRFTLAASGSLAVLLAACTSPNNLTSTTNPGVNVGGASNPASAAYFEQTVGDRVFFAVDQTSLTPEAMQILDDQANWLLQHPTHIAVVEGHTDEQGTREYNLGLGARRANAVMEYLIYRGVADTRLRSVSYGKERPIEICSNETCYAKNRRAVTVLSRPVTG